MDVTIKDLQAYLAHHYNPNGNEQSLFMKLVEEMGETAEVLNKRAGRKASDAEDLQAQLAEELADVIHYAAAIASINDIDLTRAIVEKDQRAAVKYHHDMNLQDFIKNLR